jgi:nucleoside-diphosphate-sugar epimerase
VNILTNHAYHNRKITVFGGSQMRPNIHINDVVDLYDMLLELPSEKIAGETFNAGYENHTVADLAVTVRDVIAQEVPELGLVKIVTTPSDDNRSYHISSDKIRRALGFSAKRTIADAVRDLIAAFRAGLLPNSMTDPSYYNIRTMQLEETKLTA